MCEGLFWSCTRICACILVHAVGWHYKVCCSSLGLGWCILVCGVNRWGSVIGWCWLSCYFLCGGMFLCAGGGMFVFVFLGF